MRRRRQSLSRAEKDRASQALCDTLARHLDKPEGHVAAFMPNDGEISPKPWLKGQLRRGRVIALPRITDDNRMEFAPVDSFDQLKPGRYGIPEPTTVAVRTDNIAAFLVPGVAFDKQGGRIGMGAGYYDQALSEHIQSGGRAPRIGIAYTWQLLQEPLPREPHDVSMTHIATPEDWLPIDQPNSQSE